MRTIPSPAFELLTLQAASDLIVLVPGGREGVGVMAFSLIGFCWFLFRLHSLASRIAFDNVSSADTEVPSKKNLFLSFQMLHRIHGASDPSEMPVGGNY